MKTFFAFITGGLVAALFWYPWPVIKIMAVVGLLCVVIIVLGIVYSCETWPTANNDDEWEDT